MLTTRYPLLATSASRVLAFFRVFPAVCGGLLLCLWLLLCVCAGLTDLREELHRLGLD